MIGKLRAVALLFLVVAPSTIGTDVSPVQKVVQLIDEMKAKVEAEGQAAAEDFEEFAKWCDDEADDKDRAIQASQDEIQDLKATIEEASATITNLETRIEDLSTSISSAEKELADATAARSQGHKVFATAEEELVDTVDTLGHDAELIKSEMGGGSFLQGGKFPESKSAKIQMMLQSMRRIVDSAWVSIAAKAKVQTFLQQRAEEDDALSQQPAAYESSSGGILGAINDMEGKAEDSLSEERKQEMKDQNAFDLLKMALSNEIKDLNDQMAKATARKQFTGQELASAQKSLGGTQKSLAEDQKYLVDLKRDCQVKASEYEEEYKDRANEVGALSKAKEIMSAKFSFLQTSITTRSLSNLKVFDDRKQEALQMIHRLGKQLDSTLLVSLSYRALADPFAKVKTMIEEMINKLLQEAAEGADHKAFCDKELGQTTSSKAEKEEKVATVNSRMATATAASSKLEEAIKMLTAQVAEIDAAVAEATKIRAAEKSAFEKAAKEYSESQEACAAAIEVLRNYYESGAFVQLKAATTVMSKMRMTARAGTSDSSGIIGMLEVAESDFSKLLVEAKTAEDTSTSEFDKMVQENKVLKATKNADIKGATSELASIAANLENFGEDKEGLTKELGAVAEYLDKLKPQCEYQVPSYEERKARREKEIEGLQEALSVLEGEGVPVGMVQKSASIERVSTAAGM